MCKRRLLAAASVALLGIPGALLSHQPAAAAEPHGVITSVTPSADGLVVEFEGRDLPLDAQLDSGSVQVLVNGTEVSATAQKLEETRTPDGARRVALVVDTSGSMAGAPLEAARAAARAYLGAVPADVEVGLIAFAASPQVVSAPTTDRAVVAAALPQLTATGGTSLYDAVLRAKAVLGEQGQRRVVVLSDGEDSASKASLDAAAAAVTAGGLAVDVVALGKAAPAMPALKRLAEHGRGRVLQAGDDVEAVAAFQEAARAFSAGLRLEVKLPSNTPGGAANLNVEIPISSGLVLHAVSPIVLPDGASNPGWLSSKAAQVTGLVVLFAGLAGALIAGVRSGDTQAVRQRRTEQVLAAYTLRGSPLDARNESPSRVGTGALARAALALAGRVLERGERGRRLTLRLDCAAVRFTAREWLVLQASISLGASLLVLLVSNIVLAVLIAGLAATVVHLWLAVKAGRRAKAFEAEMPDALQLVASGLSTGYSLPQALDSVVNEGRPPLADELGRALAEARLGAPLENALDNVADRMDSTDFRWVVMAIRVQREVGGNLSEILQTLVQTMRDRSALRRQIKALSAEGRLGAIILTALPFIVAAYLTLVNADFFRPMWETTLGITLLSGCVVALALGAFWMTKLVKVEA